MCAIAKFLLYSSSIFDIVMINDKFTHLFIELLVYYAHMLGSRKYVSMVLRYNLLAIHPLSIRLVEQWFLEGLSFVLDLLG
jgi:hypothetical protein